MKKIQTYNGGLERSSHIVNLMVGAEGFEPPTLCSQSRCATRLRYAPTPKPFLQIHAPVSSCEVPLFLTEKPRQVCLKSRIHCANGRSRLYQVAQGVEESAR